MGSIEESGASNRQVSDGGVSMGCSDDSNSTDSKQTPIPSPDPAESAGPTGWLFALNSFLEHAFLKADRDTGC
jgi:hypothetical protein